MNGNRSLAISTVMALSVVIAGCGGTAPVQSGTLTKVGGNHVSILKATLGTANDPGEDEQNFAAAVSTLSGGTIDIALSGPWRQGDPNSEAGLVNDVVAGKADLGLIGTRGFDTVGVNSFAALQTPMLVDSLDLEAKVLATDWATKVLDGPRSIGIVGLGYVQGELRQALGLTRDLVQISDFQGARIGIRPSHVTDMTLKALGATGVPLAIPQDITGLDGLELGAPGVAGNEFYKDAKSFTGNLLFWPRPQVLFANAKWFDSLSTDQQAQLRAAVAQTSQLSATRLPDNTTESRNTFCSAAFAIKAATSTQLDAFRVKLQPVIDEMSKDPTTKATIAAITALRASSGIAPDVIAPCSPASAIPSPNSGPTALDGTWKTSYTKAELIASPFLDDPGTINDGNWGDFTMTFANGRFRATQTNPIESSSGGGTFTVSGDVITLAQDDGETLIYRWSIYKNTLTFKRDLTLQDAPTPILVKPWTRAP
jgi:TRAP-type C4-dicarboxylate transport system substrate-binding protein